LDESDYVTSTVIQGGGVLVDNGNYLDESYLFVPNEAVGTTIDSGGIYEIAGNATTLYNTTVSVGGGFEFADTFQPTFTFASSTGQFTVSAGDGNYATQLSGDYTGETFVLSEDASNDAFLTLETVACYCAGTRISTKAGEVAIEALRIGDQVVTIGGALQPIRWIGRRAYGGRFVAANPGVRPVRFRSLGDGLPHRDLLVSPEHAMLLDGLLVPARCLINGTTIVQAHGSGDVHYIHIELAEHAVVLAEGAASETFLDDRSRGMFHNAADYAARYPDAPRARGFCARRVEAGAELDAIRKRLEPSGVQEVRLDRDGVHRIRLEPGAGSVRLVTGSGYVAGDARRLGAAIRRVAVDGLEIALNDPRLAAGWHPAEENWRWMADSALLLTPCAMLLEIDVVSLPFATAA
jgi:hypothetical protein